MSADNLTLAALIIVIVMIIVVMLLNRSRSETNRQMRKMARQMALIQTNEKARAVCQKIREQHPDLCAGIDFTLREAGGEVHIDEWNCDKPKPDL